MEYVSNTVVNALTHIIIMLVYITATLLFFHQNKINVTITVDKHAAHRCCIAAVLNGEWRWHENHVDLGWESTCAPFRLCYTATTPSCLYAGSSPDNHIMDVNETETKAHQREREMKIIHSSVWGGQRCDVVLIIHLPWIACLDTLCYGYL